MFNWKRSLMRRLIHSIHPYFYDTHVIYGNPSRLKIGVRVGLANTLFNLSSGQIIVGDRTIFGHNVQCLTGTHLFHNGQRVSIWEEFDDGSYGGGEKEVPANGRDIHIGNGCFIGSGAILIGPLTIGDNSIVGAGAIVTKDIPINSVVMGQSAKIVCKT
jgi:acetyltransferase-like isoleucine patch superfamily enzyme